MSEHQSHLPNNRHSSKRDRQGPPNPVNRRLRPMATQCQAGCNMTPRIRFVRITGWFRPTTLTWFSPLGSRHHDRHLYRPSVGEAYTDTALSGCHDQYFGAVHFAPSSNAITRQNVSRLQSETIPQRGVCRCLWGGLISEVTSRKRGLRKPLAQDHFGAHLVQAPFFSIFSPIRRRWS